MRCPKLVRFSNQSRLWRLKSCSRSSGHFCSAACWRKLYSLHLGHWIAQHSAPDSWVPLSPKLPSQFQECQGLRHLLCYSTHRPRCRWQLPSRHLGRFSGWFDRGCDSKPNNHAVWDVDSERDDSSWFDTNYSSEPEPTRVCWLPVFSVHKIHWNLLFNLLNQQSNFMQWLRGHQLPQL